MTWRPVLAAQSARVEGPRPEPVSTDRVLSLSKDRVPLSANLATFS